MTAALALPIAALLTAAQVGARLGIEASDVLAYLPSYRIGRLVRYDMTELEVWGALRHQPGEPAMIDTTMLTRAEAIRRISDALLRRSGRRWSVTGGRGTAYGWLRIDVPPRLRTWHFVDTGKTDDAGSKVFEEVNDPSREFGHMGPAYREKLCELLGIENPRIHYQGVSIPSSTAHYREYIERAETGGATEIAERYWD